MYITWHPDISHGKDVHFNCFTANIKVQNWIHNLTFHSHVWVVAFHYLITSVGGDHSWRLSLSFWFLNRLLFIFLVSIPLSRARFWNHFRPDPSLFSHSLAKLRKTAPTKPWLARFRKENDRVRRRRKTSSSPRALIFHERIEPIAVLVWDLGSRSNCRNAAKSRRPISSTLRRPSQGLLLAFRVPNFAAGREQDTQSLASLPSSLFFLLFRSPSR